MYSYLSPSIRKSLLLVWLSSIWTLSTVVIHIYLSVTHPLSCIREHQEHHGILKDISRFPGFVNAQTYRTSRIGSLDVFFRDCLPSVNQAPLDPNFFSTPTPMWKSVKILWIFVPSCALMAHGESLPFSLTRTQAPDVSQPCRPFSEALKNANSSKGGPQLSWNLATLLLTE